MQKLISSRWVVLFLSFVGLAALLLLSVALRDLQFSPPLPFSIDLGGMPSPLAPSQGMQIPWWRVFLFVLLVLMILSIILLIIDKEFRKRVLMRMLRTALVILAIWVAVNFAFQQGAMKDIMNLTPAGGLNTSQTVDQSNIPVYTPQPVNPWLAYIISFAIGLGLVLIAGYFYSRRPPSAEQRTVEQVADIARDALSGLEPGQNWDDAIVRAYIRLNEVVMLERGLVRQPANTPAEFALRMERMGLPGEAVRTLTGLFEGVRYGGRTSTPAERDLAAAALGAILHTCGRHS